MGRRKLEIKKIEDKSSRQRTFSRRRNGLMKKAKELAVLCDVQVAAVILSGRGKLYHFCSSNRIISNYPNDPLWEKCFNGITATWKRKKMDLQELVIERDLKEPNVDQLNLTDPLHLEKQLQTAVTQTRSIKTQLMMDFIKSLHKVMAQMNREGRKPDRLCRMAKD